MKEEEIYDYGILKKEYKKDLAKLIRLRDNFVATFPIERIKSLEIDEYVVGKQSKKSFCYRIETQLKTLGNMKGSTSSKFGIYYGVKGKDKEVKYRFTKKYGNEIDGSFKEVKSEIHKLLLAGKDGDYKKIIKNKVAPLFKYKLLGTYFTDKYLNVYSIEHLDFFIGELGINSTSKNILGKQNSIIDFKNNNPISKEWSNLEFSRFLYNKIGAPPKKQSDKDLIHILPPMDKIKLEIIDLDFSNREVQKSNGNRSGKIDHIKQNLRNAQLGKRGEYLVFNHEIDQAIKLNLDRDEIELTSETNDRAGYDIKSLTINGEAKYIEVKSTKAKPGVLSLNITANEIEKAKTLSNYFVYVVFEANTKSPKLWKMNNSFKEYLSELTLIPVAYKLHLNTSEKEKIR